MKTAYLEDADRAAVSEAVVAFLKGRGALVSEHSHSHAKFYGLNPGREFSFAKGGYIGTYRHTGETEVELRLRLRATWPARLFWGVTFTTIIVAAIMFAVNPGSGLWMGVAGLFYAAWFGTLLLYLGTFRSTWQVEAETFDALIAELAELDAVAGDVLTSDERLERDFEEAVDGEVVAVQLKRTRQAEAKAARAAKKAKPAAAKPAKPAKVDDAGSDKAPAKTSAAAGAAAKLKGLKLPSLKRAKKDAAPAPSADDRAAKEKRLAELRKELEKRKGGGS